MKPLKIWCQYERCCLECDRLEQELSGCGEAHRARRIIKQLNSVLNHREHLVHQLKMFTGVAPPGAAVGGSAAFYNS